jgi:hypothetical protein
VKPPAALVEALEAEVARVTRVGRSELRAVDRSHRVAAPRWAVWHVLALAGWSVGEIAQEYDRDHSTVSQALARFPRRLADPELADLVAALQRVVAREGAYHEPPAFAVITMAETVLELVRGGRAVLDEVERSAVAARRLALGRLDPESLEALERVSNGNRRSA